MNNHNSVTKETIYPDVKNIVLDAHTNFINKELQQYRDDADSLEASLSSEQERRAILLNNIGHENAERNRYFNTQERVNELRRWSKYYEEIQSYLDKYRLKFIPSDVVARLAKYDMYNPIYHHYPSGWLPRYGTVLYEKLSTTERISVPVKKRTWFGFSVVVGEEWMTQNVVTADVNDMDNVRGFLVNQEVLRYTPDKLQVVPVLNTDLVLCSFECFDGTIPTKNLEEIHNFPLRDQLPKNLPMSAIACILTPAINVRTDAELNNMQPKIIDPVVLIPVHAFEGDLGRIVNDFYFRGDGYVMVTAWGEEAELPEFMNAHNN